MFICLSVIIIKKVIDNDCEQHAVDNVSLSFVNNAYISQYVSEV